MCTASGHSWSHLSCTAKPVTLPSTNLAVQSSQTLSLTSHSQFGFTALPCNKLVVVNLSSYLFAHDVGKAAGSAHRDAGLRRAFLELQGLMPKGGLDLPLGLVKLSLGLPMEDRALL